MTEQPGEHLARLRREEPGLADGVIHRSRW